MVEELFATRSAARQTSRITEDETRNTYTRVEPAHIAVPILRGELPHYTEAVFARAHDKLPAMSACHVSL